MTAEADLVLEANKLVERVRAREDVLPLHVALLCDLVPELVQEIERLRAAGATQ